METLINKIKEYTIDGSPGVGQLIELQDIAKKEKVSRVALEKLITEALETQKKTETISTEKEEVFDTNEAPLEEITITPNVDAENSFVPYERPDLESARASFDNEMLARQEQENHNIETNATLFETREEVVFPELNVSFEKEEKKEVYDYQTPELPNPKVELPEIVQQTEIISDFKTIELEQPDITFEPQNNDFSVDKPQDVKQVVESISGITFEPNEIESVVEVEITEEGERIIGFEEALKEQNKGAENEDILRKIITENKHAREKAERDKRILEKTSKPKPPSSTEVKTKVENSKSSNLKSTNRDKYFRTDNNSTKQTITLQQSQLIRTLSFIAIFIAVITPFYIIALIGGSIGMSTADKYKKIIKENQNLYGEDIVKAVNLSYVLFLISFIVGILKIWSWFS